MSAEILSAKQVLYSYERDANIFVLHFLNFLASNSLEGELELFLVYMTLINLTILCSS